MEKKKSFSEQQSLKSEEVKKISLKKLNIKPPLIGVEGA